MEFKSINTEVINIVGWNFGPVHFVDQESEAKEEGSEEEETAIAATYALKETTTP